MNEQLRLLELANKRAANDKEFIGYILKKYGEIEKCSNEEIRSKLNCSLKDYYRLSLCKTPSIDSSDFIEQLNRVAAHSNISMMELNALIKRVVSVEKFSEAKSNTWLIAARDKRGDPDKPDGD